MVVSISEQIWSINFKEILTNHNLFIRHIRYVDNRLIFGTGAFVIFHHTKFSMMKASTENPLCWKQNRTKNFSDLCLKQIPSNSFTVVPPMCPKFCLLSRHHHL